MAVDVEGYRRLARIRVAQLADEDEVLRRWLVSVRFFGWPLFIISLVCPIAVGSVSLSGLLGSWAKVTVPILSFLGAAAIALHRGLHCETYQQGLKHTILSIRSIVEDFETISVTPGPQVVAEFKKAEARLRDLRRRGGDLPPKRRRSWDELFDWRGDSLNPD
jgi:hypothetical protein